jgi:hypothetical protein
MTPTLYELLPDEAADRLYKFAAEEAKPEGKAKRIAKTVGSGLAGIGLGTFAGGLAFEGGRRGYEKLTGKSIPKGPLMTVLPALGAGAGLAYSIYKAQEQEEIRRALESQDNKPSGGSR